VRTPRIHDKCPCSGPPSLRPALPKQINERQEEPPYLLTARLIRPTASRSTQTLDAEPEEKRCLSLIRPWDPEPTSAVCPRRRPIHDPLSSPSLDPSHETLFLFIAVVMIAAQVRLSAQETAGRREAAPVGPVPTNQPSGLLPRARQRACADAERTIDLLLDNEHDRDTTRPAKVEPARGRGDSQRRFVRRQELIYRSDESLKAGRKARLAPTIPKPARLSFLRRSLWIGFPLTTILTPRRRKA